MEKNSNSTKLHVPQREREELLFTISWETFYSQTSGGDRKCKESKCRQRSLDKVVLYVWILLLRGEGKRMVGLRGKAVTCLACGFSFLAEDYAHRELWCGL